MLIRPSALPTAHRPPTPTNVDHLTSVWEKWRTNSCLLCGMANARYAHTQRKVIRLLTTDYSVTLYPLALVSFDSRCSLSLLPTCRPIERNPAFRIEVWMAVSKPVSIICWCYSTSYLKTL